MNVLNEKQHFMLEKGISKEEYEKRKKDFLDSYYDLRQKAENGFLGRMSAKQHKRLHWLALSIIALKDSFSGLSYEIIKDKPTKANKPIIFAVTHIGKYDIEILNWAIKWHSYILTGDFERLQGTTDGLFCDLNGVVYINEGVKEDRGLASERMVKVLKSNTNLMFFPEGVWNLSPNLPMLPCYWGIIDIAKKSDALILPVAIEQYEKHFKIAFGEYFDVWNYEDKSSSISALRDEMATLKWIIWETEFTKRGDIYEKYWSEYVSDRLAEWPGYTEDIMDDLLFKPKGITEPSEAFAFCETLIPNRNNAFLFNKRLKGRMAN